MELNSIGIDQQCDGNGRTGISGIFAWWWLSEKWSLIQLLGGTVVSLEL